MRVGRIPGWMVQSVLGVGMVVALNLLVNVSAPLAQQGAAPTCAAGLEPDGSGGCKDVDECAFENGGCEESIKCVNTKGGWTCGENCPPGFTGTPEAGCVDINECSARNGYCDPLSQCFNIAGGRECGGCPPDFIGNGYAGCIDVNDIKNGQDPHPPAIAVAGNMTVKAKSAEYLEGWRILERKVAEFTPQIVVFVGVTLYRALAKELGGASAAAITLGFQRPTIHGARIFVLPNPSGRNANFSYAEMLEAFKGLADRD